MAHIAVMTHPFDAFAQRPYLLSALAGHWQAQGHRITLVEGTPARGQDADIAILHVDQSLVPESYLQHNGQRARVINGAALDIRKRKVSRALLQPGADWPGEVIVKTDLNRGGLPELHHARQMHKAGLPTDPALQGLAFSTDDYPILPSIDAVPAAIWDNPGLVVERFLPERDRNGFALRIWTFFGEQERCTRYVSRTPLIKGDNMVADQAVQVPDHLRQERARLGFDYGKFDFVLHEGQAVLLDANRTPFAPPASANPTLAASNALLANGLAGWLSG